MIAFNVFMVFSVGVIKTKMMLESKVYYCNIIQFCVKLGKSPMETFQMMKEAEIGKTVSRSWFLRGTSGSRQDERLVTMTNALNALIL